MVVQKKNSERRVRVIRNNEEVDPQSTRIRSDQATKLKLERPPVVRRVSPMDPLKLVTKEPEDIYSWKRHIKCERCKKISPTKRMYVYRRSTKGTVGVCENCIESVERESFLKLDALDKVRKDYKIE